MHEVVPKVVAIAVSTVMAICRIFCQSSFLFMIVVFKCVINDVCCDSSEFR